MSGLYHAVGKAIGTESASGDLPTYSATSDAANKAFDLSNYDQSTDSYLNSQLANSQTRTGATSDAAQNNVGAIDQAQYQGANIAPTYTYGGQAVGATQQGTAAQVAPAAQSTGQDLGAADQSTAATIDRSDNDFRNAQLGLQTQLQGEAAGTGPSLAVTQLQSATDRNIQNQAALAASQGGRNAGTVQRGLALGAQQTNAAAANQAAQTRATEQLNAQNSLASLTASGRSADIGVNTSQAGLDQQTALANQAAVNAQTLNQANLNQSNNQFNTSAVNTNQLQQANLNQNMTLANQSNVLSNQQLQANLYQSAGLANQSAINTRSANQASLLQAAGLQGSQNVTNAMLGNTANQQQTALANQSAAMQQAQLNDAMAQYYQSAKLGVDSNAQNALMSQQQLQAQAVTGEAKLQSAADEAQSSRFGGFLGGVASAVSGGAVSDENQKQGVEKANMDDYLQSLKSKASDGFASKLTGPTAANGSLTASVPLENPADPGKRLAISNSGRGGYVSDVPSATSNQNAGQEAGDEESSSSSSRRAPQAAQKAAPRKMTPEELSAYADQMMGNVKAMKETAEKDGPSVQDKAPAQDFSWMDAATSDENLKTSVTSGGVGAKNFIKSIGNDAMTGLTKMNNDPTPNYTAGSSKFGSALGSMGMGFGKQLAGAMGGGGNGVPLMGDGSNVAAPTGLSGGGSAATPGGGMAIGSAADDAGGGIGGALDAISDKNEKENIDGDNEKIKEYLDNIKAYTYNYKNPSSPGQGEGRFTSPMAQDMEKSELGSQMVHDTPGGKVVDYPHHLGTIHGSLAYLNEELNKLKGKGGRANGS